MAKAYLPVKDYYQCAQMISDNMELRFLGAFLDNVLHKDFCILFSALSYLLHARLLGRAPGDWQRCFMVFVKLAEVKPRNIFAEVFLYNSFALLATQSKNDALGTMWCVQWDRIKHSERDLRSRGIGCWKIYLCLPSSGSNPEIAKRLLEQSMKVLTEYLNREVTHDETSIGVMCLACAVIVDNGKSSETECLINDLMKIILSLGIELIAKYSSHALSRLALRLAEGGHIDTMARMSEKFLPVMNMIGDPDASFNIAQVVSLGFRAMAQDESRIPSLEKYIERYSKEFNRLKRRFGNLSFYGQELNLAVTKVELLIRYKCIRNDEMLNRVFEELQVLDKNLPETCRDSYKCTFLCTAISEAYNNFKDEVGDVLYERWNDLFARRLDMSNQVLFMKERIRWIVKDRPVHFRVSRRPECFYAPERTKLSEIYWEAVLMKRSHEGENSIYAELLNVVKNAGYVSWGPKEMKP